MVAELGKSRYVPVSDLQAGMIVKKTVIGRNNKALVNAGEVLSQLHVEKLNSWEKREKPQGPAFPRVNRRNEKEPIRHGEFQGGYKVSHFNPKGIMVAGTTASGEEFPDIERHPENSKTFLKVTGKPNVSMSMDSIPESDVVQRRNQKED
jgi:hypothetical protein